MTASGISRILSSAGLKRSKTIPGRIVARRSEGFTVRAAGNDKDGKLVVVVEHEFDRYYQRENDTAEAEQEWLERYKIVLEARAFNVRLVKGQYSSSLVVTV